MIDSMMFVIRPIVKIVGTAYSSRTCMAFINVISSEVTVAPCLCKDVLLLLNSVEDVSVLLKELFKSMVMFVLECDIELTNFSWLGIYA